MKTSIELIAEERERQKTEENFTGARDRRWSIGELAMAAACYAIPFHERLYRAEGIPRLWPWPDGWKPTPHDRRRELVKAGALIAAELDRLADLEERASKS